MDDALSAVLVLEVIAVALLEAAGAAELLLSDFVAELGLAVAVLMTMVFLVFQTMADSFSEVNKKLFKRLVLVRTCSYDADHCKVTASQVLGFFYKKSMTNQRNAAMIRVQQ